MTISVEALLVASIMMAVFAAVSTVGSSLYLGAGYERLRAGYELIRKQTAFFSDSIHNLDKRVDVVEKQSSYFFEAITGLEEGLKTPLISETATAEQESFIMTDKADTLSGHGQSVLSEMSFTMQEAEEESIQQDSVESSDDHLWNSLDSSGGIHFH